MGHARHSTPQTQPLITSYAFVPRHEPPTSPAPGGDLSPSAQLNTSNSAQLSPTEEQLVAAVQTRDLHAAREILRPGVDADFLCNGVPPLAMAARNKDKQMMRLLLDSGADEQYALIALCGGEMPADDVLPAFQQCIDHFRRRARRSKRAHIRACLRTCKLMFFGEHKRMHGLVTASRHAAIPSILRRVAARSRGPIGQISRLWECIPGSAESRHAWSANFIRDQQAAWEKCVGVFDDLMKGHLPRALDAVLLFLVFVWSMSAQVGGRDAEQFRHEFAQDLSRWRALFYHDPKQLRSFEQATRELFRIDVASMPATPTDELARALATFRAQAHQLLRIAREDLGGQLPRDDVAVFTAHANCTVKEESSPDNSGSGDALGPDVVMSGMEESPTHDTCIGPGAEHDPGPALLGTDPLDNTLVLILAGVAFAAILGFLLGIRGLLHGSLKPLGGPLASTLLIWHVNADPQSARSKWLYEVVTRTTELLRQYLQPPDPQCQCREGTQVDDGQRELSPARMPMAYPSPLMDNHNMTPSPGDDELSEVPEAMTWSGGSLGHHHHQSRVLPDTPGVSAMATTSTASTASSGSSPPGQPPHLVQWSPAVHHHRTSGPPRRGRQQQRTNLKCETCGKWYSTTSNLGKHVREVHARVRYTCSRQGCRRSYARNDTLTRHLQRHHGGGRLE
ncbi:uncharacterized protein B0I36DRAFT_335308 [Microdochium trichocladiopsis]|uniref:C2H2-type domain-containing protein n=1 Tax=Microdochium trichocladiopsis TaxID=1682393 RepID=A0A9P8XU10_9PEZI|nr:uncharacterized protein B0I36DRAFT_335308 [Microdochium trichocladiopsis]KAH7018097.1 hypothetical protein B0I36DRAFT_335308 [Microdochium trichocladiopsis]